MCVCFTVCILLCPCLCNVTTLQQCQFVPWPLRWARREWCSAAAPQQSLSKSAFSDSAMPYFNHINTAPWKSINTLWSYVPLPSGRIETAIEAVNVELWKHPSITMISLPMIFNCLIWYMPDFQVFLKELAKHRSSESKLFLDKINCYLALSDMHSSGPFKLCSN